MWRFPVAVFYRPFFRRAALATSFLAGSATTALALQLSATTLASADGASASGGPPSDAEAEEARRVLEAYFATTEPAVGGRGAVRLKQPLVNGEASVDAYKRSLVEHADSAGSSSSASPDGASTRPPAPPAAHLGKYYKKKAYDLEDCH